MLLNLGKIVKTPDGKMGRIVTITQMDHTNPIYGIYGDDFLVNISRAKLEKFNIEIDNREFKDGEGI